MPVDYARVKVIVADALDVPPPSRAAFLDTRCGADAALRREVESLLSAGDLDGPFLELDQIPDRLGPYRIVSEIGSGGMGAVFAAERDDGEFEQRVAIKIIKRGLDTAAVLRRFVAERQILARLTHPNITRLLDGGTTPDGRPYFAMEYIEGEPIGDYCRAGKLSLDARIDLLIAVCDAVEYAHHNLVLHRDIKAGNILVARDGSPKLLDFGIAKLLEDDDDAQQTAVGARAWTPTAASPEQVRGEPLSTASDVYALGVLAYELLTGRAPYDVSGQPHEHVVRIVSAFMPPAPSAIADGRDSRRLRGDLDQVILKALEKSPGDRYQRAAEFAEDLRRFRLRLPVSARRGGRAYRARKFAARHKRSLAIAAVATIAIVGSVGRALYEGRVADRRFRDLRELADTFVFEFYDSIATLPGSTPARELVIRRGLEYLDRLSKDAGSDLDLKRELAQAYERIGVAQGSFHDANLGKTSDARANFEKSLALFEAVSRGRPNDPAAAADLGEAYLRMAAVTDFAGHRADAEAFDRRALDAIARTPALDSKGQLVFAMANFGLAEILASAGKIQDALETRNRSISALQVLTAKSPDDWQALHYLAQSYKRLMSLYFSQLKDNDRAAAALALAMSIDQRLAAHDPSSAVSALDLATDQGLMATIKHRAGEADASIDLMRQSIGARRAMLAVDSRNFRLRSLLAQDSGKLGTWLREQHRLLEARDAVQQGLELAAGLNPDNPDTTPILKALQTEAAATASALRARR